MTKEIICFSTNKSATLLNSIGVEVKIIEDIKNVKSVVNDNISLNSKVIIVDEDVNDLILDIKEKYEDEVYPIFLVLPFGELLTGKSLNEMKKNIEKTIGISGF